MPNCTHSFIDILYNYTAHHSGYSYILCNMLLYLVKYRHRTAKQLRLVDYVPSSRTQSCEVGPIFVHVRRLTNRDRGNA